MDSRIDIYKNFSELFKRENSLKLDEVISKSQLTKEKVEEFLKSNLLYHLKEDQVIREDKLTLSLVGFTIEQETEVSTQDLREAFEQQICEAAYIRFQKTLGQVVVPSD